MEEVVSSAVEGVGARVVVVLTTPLVDSAVVIGIVDVVVDRGVDCRDVVVTPGTVPGVTECVPPPLGVVTETVESGGGRVVVLSFSVVLPWVVDTTVVLSVVVDTPGGGLELVEDAGVVINPGVVPGPVVVAAVVEPGVVEPGWQWLVSQHRNLAW